jgi:cytochrome c553
LIALDLPTFERPAKAISGGPGGGSSAPLPTAAINCACENNLIKSRLSMRLGDQGMIRALACVASAAAAFCATAQAQDLAKAQNTANQVCAACHAADGNSTAPANPKIAGQIPEYLHKQLVDFKPQGGKKPARENAIMMGMVANLSEADMKGLAAYYAGQKLKPAAAADKNLAALGQKLWRGGNSASGVPACAGCHGPAGAGMPAQYPRLAGQYAEYIAAQLKAFKEGGRANDPNGMMRGVTARMTEREIRAVAEYAAGLR